MLHMNRHRTAASISTALCGVLFALGCGEEGLSTTSSIEESAQSSLSSSQGTARYRITGVSTKEARTSVAQTGAGIDEVGADYVIVTATDTEYRKLQRLGFSIQPDIRLMDFPSGDSAFHNYTEMVDTIQQAANAYPNIVKKFSIGNSYEGRAIWAAKISDNVNTDEEEPEVLFVGQHHAREHITVEMTLYLLKLLTENYGTDLEITRLVNSREIYIVFNSNPDGGEYDISSGNYAWWRKNRQPNSNGSYGTDLNRNYSYKWGCCNGSSTDPSSDTYRGTTWFSAPETKALRDFIQGRVIRGTQQIRTGITFHSYGPLVLWPFGYTYDDVTSSMPQEDHDVFEKMGRYMASTNGYTAEQASDLYITDGSLDDWAYGLYKIFMYTFEMGGGSFYPSGSQIDSLTQVNRAAVLYLLKNSACPYSTIGRPEKCIELPPEANWSTEGHPFDAVRAGTDSDGTSLYPCRALYQGGLHPGKTRSNWSFCDIGYGGQERAVQPYESLVPFWMEAVNGTMPRGAMPFGNDGSGGPTLYPCRAYMDGKGLQLGKFRPEFGGCNIPYGGREYGVTRYQVLTTTLPLITQTLQSEKPNSAHLVGGYDSDGSPLYVCQAEYNGGLVPGKTRANWNYCDVAWGGSEHAVQRYNVLLPKFKTPDNPFPAGYENGAVLGICRTAYSSGIQVGKYLGSGRCNFGYGGSEVSSSSNYNVLSF